VSAGAVFVVDVVDVVVVVVVDVLELLLLLLLLASRVSISLILCVKLSNMCFNSINGTLTINRLSTAAHSHNFVTCAKQAIFPGWLLHVTPLK